MKASTILLTLLPIALATPQDTAAVAPSDFIAEGFNTQAANYLASAFANPGVSSAFGAYDSAIGSAIATQTAGDVDTVPTNSAGDLDPNAILSAFVPGFTVAPTPDRYIISSVVLQALSFESVASSTAGPASASAASVSGAASSLAQSASAVASSAGAAASSATPSKAAAAPRQTVAAGLVGAMLAGVAGVAAAL